MLQSKNILLGITGSIAAYKSAFLCRLLVKQGYDVKVIMTPSAIDFISPLTLSTLSGHTVAHDISDGETWNNHVELGLWADLMIVAPCTASSLSKMANGHSDNLLIATYLSAKCPVFIAPAMDLDMYQHPTTKRNLNLLTTYGNQIVQVGAGFLASGLHGEGRMAEPEDILTEINHYFNNLADLNNKNILITAGPTHEALDPVRFIGNKSSGKMGIALAKECARRGAKVTLVLGPAIQRIHDIGIEIMNVTSAQEMFEVCNEKFDNSDVIILAAAVADYKPAMVSSQKMKKNDDELHVELVRTIDIASTLGKKKGENQIMIGFALETNDEIFNAKQKLHKKNLDFIVLNSLSDSGAGFQYDTNKVTILDNEDNNITYSLKSKNEVAKDIIDYLVNNFIN